MTSVNHLLREDAPIPTRAWKSIDDEARDRLKPLLAARRVVDWVGPGGWQHDSMTIGRTAELTGPPGVETTGAITRRRLVLPLAEVRIPFTIDRAEISDIQRGSLDPDFEDLDRAVRAAALIETRTVFHGWPAAGMAGIAEASTYPKSPLGDDCMRYPALLAKAVDQLRRNGVGGPYSVVVNPDVYTAIVERTEHGGYLLLDHLIRVLGGSVIWAPGVDGAIVVADRGGDFLLDVGQDLSIGYSDHDAQQIYLYLEETMAFRVVSPDAAVIFVS